MKNGNCTVFAAAIIALAVTPNQTPAQPIYTPYTITTIAGTAGPTGNGTNDGNGSAAQFLFPGGVTVDTNGNVYVADTSNHTIRKITPAGAVTTLAGTPRQNGNSDGTGSAAQFFYPASVAVDTNGNVYVADWRNDTIRKITPAGAVTTFAGSAGQIGSANGTGSAARFNSPTGVAVDSAGNVYVADDGNNTIRKITPSGVATTLAGLALSSGSTDGTGGSARFNDPESVAVDGGGNVYVADTGNNTIRKISPSGQVTTWAGTAGTFGNTDATGSAARFSSPEGVAVDSATNVYVGDYGNNTIRKITPSRVVTTLAGCPTCPNQYPNGYADGTGSIARFDNPAGLAVDSAGNVYVADNGNSTIRKGALVNDAPVVANPLLDQHFPYGSALNFTFAANTFTDPDAGQTLSYTAIGLTPGITFDGPSRTFSGKPSTNGTFPISVTATDDGSPALSTTNTFTLVVAKAALVVTADNKSRSPGQADPPLTGTLAGVRNNENITATYATTATLASPPGNYPITPQLIDPDGRLPNYEVTTNAGTLTVEYDFLITSASDNGPGSLRQAIADAAPGNYVGFSVTGTITLFSDLLIDKSITIIGPGATNLTIRADYNYNRIFEVTAGPTLISGLTLTGFDYYGTPSGGGAIRNTAQLTLLECEFANNISAEAGGAVLSTGASANLVVIGCTFSQNRGGFYLGAGGAIWSDHTLQVTNCTFEGNYSTYGGAVYSTGDAVIASSTLTGNGGDTYSGAGGGIFSERGTLTLQNSIVAGNSAYTALDVSGVINSGDYNLIQNTDGLAVPGTHNVLNQDPVMGPLKDNGGPTRTHGLASTSPALDAAEAVTSPAMDQRGVARPQAGGYDIGAFEGALPLNHAPAVTNLIPNQNGSYLETFEFILPADTFSDPDLDQNLACSATGLPYFISFNAGTRLFSGTVYSAGTFTVTVTARDDGAPPLSTNTTFDIVIPRLPLTARADDQTRYYGDPDPYFSISYFGYAPNDFYPYIDNPPAATAAATPTSPPGLYAIVLSGGSDDVYDFVGLTNGTLAVSRAPLFVTVDSVLRRAGLTNPPLTAFISGIRNDDNITVTLTTSATPSSPLGEYAITATFNDPDGKLSNYTVTVVPGVISVVDFDVDYRVLRPFGFTNEMAQQPSSRLVEGSNGWLYGTTPFGGIADVGGVYRVRLDGTEFSVLHHFSGTETGTNDDGRRGWAGVTLASDGTLYGVTTRGGFTNSGTIYRLNTDGSGYAVLRRFGEMAGDGNVPTSPLVEGSDGALYGTTYFGGASNVGTVFKVNTDGSGYAILHSFEGSDGFFPAAGVIEGQDGMLYGTTVSGADADPSSGSVFKLSKDGAVFSAIAASGASRSPLLQGTDGFLYGVTDAAGSYGSLFKVGTNGETFPALHNFGSVAGDGYFLYPGYAPAIGSLVEGTNGELFGVTHQGGNGYGGVVFAVQKDGENYHILHGFQRSSISTDGVESIAGLLQAHDGALYGTTEFGGTAYDGTLFKMQPDGTDYDILWNFLAAGRDGKIPDVALVEGTNGILYGATAEILYQINKDGTGYSIIYRINETDGIAYPKALLAGTDGWLYGLARGGVIFINGGYVSFPDRFFRVNTDGGGYTNLHTFTYLDGDFGSGASLIEGSDGVLYGTASGGGVTGDGTLFRVEKDGSGFAVLQSFDVSSGRYPNNLTQGNDGRLYGILIRGAGFDAGAFFATDTNGMGYTNLHVFGGSNSDGIRPVGHVTEGTDGRLYGVTAAGGIFGGGTIYGLEKDGSGYSVLHSLGASPTDAREPSGMAEGPDGFLYGTSYYGGNNAGGAIDPGTIFRLRKDGSGYVILHRFYASAEDGFNPNVWLLRGSDDALYGVTTAGGITTAGTIFRLFLNHVPQNLSPVLDHLIADQNAVYGASFNFAFPSDTFTDPDAGQILNYTAIGLPSGITFDGATRTFTGTATVSGISSVTLTATDDGLPPLSTNDTFNIVVAKASLTVTANSTNRPYGQANPDLSGLLIGVTNGDTITASFITTATPNSAPGDYSISPVLADPGSKLANYIITTNLGIFTVNGISLQLSSSGGSTSFCWPTNAAAFVLECATNLTPPVTWQAVTSGMTTNDTTICYTAAPDPAVASRYYRLHLP